MHKADIAGPAGRRLAEPLAEALADDGTVVGVVLNTVDDALDHGREGDRTGWRLGDITYLPDLLDAARSYARPVVLVADHGHVLDRGDSGGPLAADGVESARWRTGEPRDGEIALAGPRVLLGGGRVVVPWREEIRYTRRRAGYHGGASLAEMAVPVLVLTPTPESLPLGWSVLPVEAVEPAWWSGRRGATPPAPVSRPARRPRRPDPATEAEGLFAAPEPVGDRRCRLGSAGGRVGGLQEPSSRSSAAPRTRPRWPPWSTRSRPRVASPPSRQRPQQAAPAVIPTASWPRCSGCSTSRATRS